MKTFIVPVKFSVLSEPSRFFLIKEMPLSWDVYNLLLHRMFAHKDSYIQATFSNVTKAKAFCQTKGMDEIIEYFFEEKEKK